MAAPLSSATCSSFTSVTFWPEWRAWEAALKHSSMAGRSSARPCVMAPPSLPRAPGRATGVTASQDPGGGFTGAGPYSMAGATGVLARGWGAGRAAGRRAEVPGGPGRPSAWEPPAPVTGLRHPGGR